MTADLWLIFTSLLFFSVGFGLYFFSWPLFVQSLGASAVDLGYLTALGSFMGALSFLPGGYLADRLERRIQLLVGWAMCIPVPFLYLVARDWRQLWPGVVLFAASSFNTPALNAYVAAKARPGKLSSAMTVVYSGLSLGYVLGPLLARPLQSAWGMTGLWWVVGALYTASTIVIFWLSPDQPAGQREGGSLAGFLHLELPSPELWRVCLLFSAVAAALYLSQPFVGPYIRDALHHGVDWVNAAGAVTGLGGVVLSVVLGRHADRVGPRRGLALGLFLYAAAMVGLVLLGRWPLVWLALALRGASDGVRALMSSTIAHETLPERRGRSLGFYNLLAGLGYTAGPILGGYAYAGAAAGPFWLAAAAGALLGGYVLATAPRRG